MRSPGTTQSCECGASWLQGPAGAGPVARRLEGGLVPPSPRLPRRLWVPAAGAQRHSRLRVLLLVVHLQRLSLQRRLRAGLCLMSTVSGSSSATR